MIVKERAILHRRASEEVKFERRYEDEKEFGQINLGKGNNKCKDTESVSWELKDV